MSDRQQRAMSIIRSLDEVPLFSSAADEAAFWATHELSDELLAHMGPVPEGVLPRPRTKTIPVRFDEEG
ncbi:MAG TPA: hypothetical protein VLA19_05450 [Herpetosiphonaceae bacterium]|nr:hypothetical protein [Herpetosiphonaceae bacterium]